MSVLRESPQFVLLWTNFSPLRKKYSFHHWYYNDLLSLYYSLLTLFNILQVSYSPISPTMNFFYFTQEISHLYTFPNITTTFFLFTFHYVISLHYFFSKTSMNFYLCSAPFLMIMMTHINTYIFFLYFHPAPVTMQYQFSLLLSHFQMFTRSFYCYKHIFFHL